jgi:hypothetical protein
MDNLHYLDSSTVIQFRHPAAIDVAGHRRRPISPSIRGLRCARVDSSVGADHMGAGNRARGFSGHPRFLIGASRPPQPAPPVAELLLQLLTVVSPLLSSPRSPLCITSIGVVDYPLYLNFSQHRRWRRHGGVLAAVLSTAGIGVHSGRPAQPGPSPKRSVLFEFRPGPARLNFGPCRAGPWA